MATYSTKQVADWLNVNPQTVRQYSTEFADYLSESASPPKGHVRRFADSDRELLYAAKQMLDSGMTYDAVRDQLERGVHRLEEYTPPEEEPEERPEQPTAMVSVDQLRLWVQPFQEATEEWREIARERQKEIESLREENRRLREELRQREEVEESRKSWIDRLLGR